MLLDLACDIFGWPDVSTILQPRGEGGAVCASDVAQRIREPLKRSHPGLSITTGILTDTPNSASTAAPLAIVCEFPSGASPDVLNELHRLAWNFSRTALLITLEPHRLVAWSCYQSPQLSDASKIVIDSTASHQEQLRELLHWVSLVTGDYLRKRLDHFPAEGRADRLLLKNLRHVRQQLIAAELPRDVCHDLLARVIFTQFLFHRRDTGGRPFFSDSLLSRLVEDRVLKNVPDGLPSILKSKAETYSLFRWLDDRFNGDLFPGKENQPEGDREVAWQAEKDAVSNEHLRLLTDLVSGQIDTTDRQLTLWPLYSFDSIPLEFISSVYEEFLNEGRQANKAYYTPSHLVDYVLDAVLPWNGDEWNLRVLDPSCGSGIFLVKAFQRLIHRWRKAHDREPLVSDLRPLLANNLTGIDINPDAVRVACFSLYLAMADAIDPRHYVTRDNIKVFPRLRGTQLVRGDFFDETVPGIQTANDAAKYDLVIGNAPWGDGSTRTTSDIAISVNEKSSKKKEIAQTKAEAWATRNDWPISNNDIGPLFMAKSLQLVNDTGRVAMLQPAPPWLYQRGQPALDLRQRLFTDFTVEEVTNLSAVRRELFPDVIGPACVIVAGTAKPSPSDELHYFTPKPLRISSESTELRIEPQDVSRMTHAEAANDPLVWPVLALGGYRDLNLIRRLMRLPNLAKLKVEGKVLTRMGVIPGDQQKELPELKGKPYFEEPQFPDDVFLTLDADSVPAWDEPRVHSRDSTDFEAFKKPQLLIKQSYSTKIGRFRAAFVRSSDPEWGVVCKETYLSVRDKADDSQNLNVACLAYNCLLATYFLSLASSRLGHYITEVPTKELMTVPLPVSVPDLSNVASFDEIDEIARASYGLTKADWVVIEDLLEFSLPDAIRKTPGPGRKPTQRKQEDSVEPELTSYGQTLARVLMSTFGRDKSVACTIYQEADDERLPVRVVTLHLNWPDRKTVTTEAIKAAGLFETLGKFHRDVLSHKVRSATGEGLSFQRVAFLVHSQTIDGHRVQHVTIVKPDECRYWTRSQAMRDADELAASILKAASRKGAK